MGRRFLPIISTKETEGKHMITISDILADIDRGCGANNMLESMFLYRIIYFVNEGNKGKKFLVDSRYEDLRKTLENIVRNNLSMTNNLVIAETTVLKEGKCICLQSKSYSFSLEGYFRQISGENKRTAPYSRYANIG